MPLTLIDASSRAGIAAGLQALSASWHFSRPCYAQELQRVAQQVVDSYTEAQAVANYTTTPTHNETWSDVTLAEATLTDVPPDDPDLGGGI